MRTWITLSMPIILSAAGSVRAELRVPAFTAYFDPVASGAQIGDSGVSGWTDPATKVLWFGQIKTAGKLEASVILRLPEGTSTRLQLTVAGQAREASAKGAGQTAVTVSTLIVKEGSSARPR